MAATSRPTAASRPVGGIGDVGQRAAVGEQPEVDAAVVAQDPDAERLVARVQRDRGIDLAQRHAVEVEGLLRARHVRHDQVEDARRAHRARRERRARAAARARWRRRSARRRGPARMTSPRASPPRSTRAAPAARRASGGPRRRWRCGSRARRCPTPCGPTPARGRRCGRAPPRPGSSLSMSATAVSRTSFTVAPVAARTRLTSSSSARAEREQPVASDLLVQPRCRRGRAHAGEVADQLHALADPPVRLARVERARALYRAAREPPRHVELRGRDALQRPPVRHELGRHAPHQRLDQLEAPLDRPAAASGATARRPRSAALLDGRARRRRQVERLGRGVEDDRADADRRDAVDERVVHLHHQRGAPAAPGCPPRGSPTAGASGRAGSTSPLPSRGRARRPRRAPARPPCARGAATSKSGSSSHTGLTRPPGAVSTSRIR